MATVAPRQFYPRVASLIRAERTHRQARSIGYRIGGAKFQVLKELDSFIVAGTPADEGEVRELAIGTFLDNRRSAIFIGGTGSGRTHPCIGLAVAVIRSSSRGRFFNLVHLVNQLVQEKAAGRCASGSAHRLQARRHARKAESPLGAKPGSQYKAN